MPFLVDLFFSSCTQPLIKYLVLIFFGISNFFYRFDYVINGPEIIVQCLQIYVISYPSWFPRIVKSLKKRLLVETSHPIDCVLPLQFRMTHGVLPTLKKLMWTFVWIPLWIASFWESKKCFLFRILLLKVIRTQNLKKNCNFEQSVSVFLLFF